MTRGIRHLTVTFSNAVPISVKSRSGSLEISRLPPFASLAEAPQNLLAGPPYEWGLTSPESLRIAFNSLMPNLLNLRVSDLFLTFVVWKRTSTQD